MAELTPLGRAGVLLLSKRPSTEAGKTGVLAFRSSFPMGFSGHARPTCVHTRVEARIPGPSPDVLRGTRSRSAESDGEAMARAVRRRERRLSAPRRAYRRRVTGGMGPSSRVDGLGVIRISTFEGPRALFLHFGSLGRSCADLGGAFWGSTPT